MKHQKSFSNLLLKNKFKEKIIVPNKTRELKNELSALFENSTTMSALCKQKNLETEAVVLPTDEAEFLLSGEYVFLKEQFKFLENIKKLSQGAQLTEEDLNEEKSRYKLKLNSESKRIITEYKEYLSNKTYQYEKLKTSQEGRVIKIDENKTKELLDVFFVKITNKLKIYNESLFETLLPEKTSSIQDELIEKKSKENIIKINIDSINFLIENSNKISEDFQKEIKKIRRDQVVLEKEKNTYDHGKMLELIAKKQKEIESHNETLLGACEQRNVTKLIELIEKQRGYTLKWFAFDNRKEYLSQILDEKGNTALHIVCQNMPCDIYGEKDLIDQFKKTGNIYIENSKEFIEFKKQKIDEQQEVLSDCVNMIGILLSNSEGLLAKIENEDKQKPFHIIVWAANSKTAISDHKMFEIVRHFSVMADISVPSEYKRTLLHLACFHGFTKTAVYLIPQIQLTATDHDGNTPFHTACMNGHVELVKELIEIMDKTNSIDKIIHKKNKDKYPQTPITLAILNGHEKVVNVLREAGWLTPDEINIVKKFLFEEKDPVRKEHIQKLLNKQMELIKQQFEEVITPIPLTTMKK